MATTRLAIESRLPPGLVCAASRESVDVPDAEARAEDAEDDSEATELDASIEDDELAELELHIELSAIRGHPLSRALLRSPRSRSR